jgi:hypothetical protein
MALPRKYINWLEKIDTEKEVIFRKYGFTIYSQEELRVKSCLAANYFAERVFCGDVKEVFGESDEVNNFDRFKITDVQSKKFLTLGESNKNYLFVDPDDDNSLWMVILANNYIFKIGSNIDQLMEEWKYYENK